MPRPIAANRFARSGSSTFNIAAVNAQAAYDAAVAAQSVTLPTVAVVDAYIAASYSLALDATGMAEGLSVTNVAPTTQNPRGSITIDLTQPSRSRHFNAYASGTGTGSWSTPAVVGRGSSTGIGAAVGTILVWGWVTVSGTETFFETTFNPAITTAQTRTVHGVTITFNGSAFTMSSRAVFLLNVSYDTRP